MSSLPTGVDQRHVAALPLHAAYAKRRSFIPIVAVAIATSLALLGRVDAQTVTIGVNTQVNAHPISPLIYGVAFGAAAQVKDLNAPLNRSGGNAETTYNWEINAHNHASDWYFESLPDGVGTAPGAYDDLFISGTHAGGAEPLITIPTLGWIANLGPGGTRLDSFSVAKYGAQTATDPYWPDAGNGILASNGDFVKNNPNDANVPSTTAYQQGFVKHLVDTWGAAGSGGVPYYLMDNEPSIWFSTHRDTHPIGPTMDEILADIENYGGMVKSVDPSAQVLGPEEWGWDGFLYDGYDQQYYAAHGTYPDYVSHGDMYYIPWLLQQLSANNQATGKRILDTLSVHWYPQGGAGLSDSEYSNDVTPAMETLRNESTRSLWDPNYTDQSWIGTQVYLIPRLKGWVATYYPGTKTAITEYNWGAESFINGATAQADVYGIFGQQGLDMATRWTVPAVGTPVYNAMKMYRNYDGANSTFGDTSVSATVPDPDNVSSFAALRSSDKALTIMVINKQLTTAQPIALNVANFSGNGVAHAWQLTSANVIQQISDVPVVSGAVSTILPAQSITLFVLPAAGTPIAVPTAPSDLIAAAASNSVSLAWTASPTATSYTVLRGTSASGTRTSIGQTTSNSYTDATAVNGTTYYYAVAAVDSAGTSKQSNVASATPTAANADNSPYNFETSTQGWFSSGGMITGLQTSIVHAYRGASSLAVQFNAAGADNQYAGVYSPAVPAGATVTFHVWVPADSGITYVDPFVLQNGAGNWLWTDSTTPIADLTAGAWNTVSVTVPVGASPLYSLGVQFGAAGAWSGSCYIDSVSWSYVVPPAPTGLTARAGNAKVGLSWNSSIGAESYKVLRGPSATGPFATVGSPASNTYLDQTVTNGNKYWYAVTAVNPGGTSAMSNVVAAVPSGSDSNTDNSYYNFETSAQGWFSSGGMITAVQQSYGQAFLGLASLAVEFNGAGADNQFAEVSSPPVPPGATVTYHVWVPSGSALSGIQPYVLQGAAGGWTWTGTWLNLSQLQTNAWNTITVTVPANASPLYSMGVQFVTTAAWSGTCYVDSISWTGGVAAPAAPTGLTATAGNTRVTLTWTASSAATSYDVFRGTKSGGESTTAVATGITTTTYTNSALADGFTYYYTVAAVDSGGTSSQSGEASATPEAAVLPVPGGLTAKAGDETITLSWDASAGATGYDVYLYQASTGKYRLATETKALSYTATHYVDGVTYTFEIAAVGLNAASANSAPVTVTPTAVKISSGPTVSPSGTTAKIAWTTNLASESSVTYGTTASLGTTVSSTTSTTAPSITLSGLTAGTTYYYRVSSTDAITTATSAVSKFVQ